jgi:hypothetical protein
MGAGILGETPLPTKEEIAAYKVEAKEDRPEVRNYYIEAKMNNIDLKLAKNYLLPKFDFEGGRMDNPRRLAYGRGVSVGKCSLRCRCSSGKGGGRS